ncbi:DNA repair protein RecN [Maribacter halichondriae]|uniref:DNA repair protein RecN n=1 Tax=Maribacter halichondriae TaxID=2980554 RepID=UPI0030765379
MLVHLSIKNYALIDHLDVRFNAGFTVITGETGAGKSILLGGLSLVLGKRAELSSLRDTDQKCIIEADFEIGKYSLADFFKDNDLDYESRTILRREILPSGKSRAFVNDTPVTLDVLSRLGSRLIDVHSQHQTLQLADNDFQFKVIDALAENQSVLTEYADILDSYNRTSKDLNGLIKRQSDEIKELDYNTFLLEELEKAPLRPGIQEELESEHEQLNNVETILEQLSKGHQLVNNDEIGILHLLSELKQASSRLSSYGKKYAALNERIQSVFIEMDDITSELESLEGGIEANPLLLEEINGKLQLLYDLQKKHGAADIGALLEIKEALSEKVSETADLESRIEAKQQELVKLEKELENTAVLLRKARNKVIPDLKKQLESSLASLGMPNAQFKIEMEPSKEFNRNGKDELVFLFSANKGTAYGELKKVASGESFLVLCSQSRLFWVNMKAFLR